MLRSHSGGRRPPLAQATVVIFLFCTLLVTNACGGDPQMRQSAIQSRSHLDQVLKHAQQVGVRPSLLAPIQQREQQLNSSSAPFNLFSDQPDNEYYQQLSKNYEQLAKQVTEITHDSTVQSYAQVRTDLLDLQNALQESHQQHLPIQSFVPLAKQIQSQFPQATQPKEYQALSQQVESMLQALHLLPSTQQELATLQKTIDLLHLARFDITALRTSYEQDQQLLSAATSIDSFQQLNAFIGAQYQQAAVGMTQAFPIASVALITEFQQQIKQLQDYGIDASPYQQKLAADQYLADTALGVQDYQLFTSQINNDLTALQNDLLRGQLQKKLQQFEQEVNGWGYNHGYYDSYNDSYYTLDAGYQMQGIGSELDAEIANASTAQDFQSAAVDISNALFNLHMLEANAADYTPYYQPHATDAQLFAHYQLTGQVIVVSLTEQAMRIYQNGSLINAFLVTTGRPERPSLPGVWSVLDRLSPTTFRSSDPPDSPYWYPPTPIHYAMLYHGGGYFIHDSWWRANYGPGTQFPHTDATGNESFAGNGSHGCINMSVDQAAWVYYNTGWNTTVLIY